MNVFSTEHPLDKDPPLWVVQLERRAAKSALCVFGGYLVLLLLLGPYWAIVGRGYLDYLPERARFAPLFLSLPVWRTPVARWYYLDYMDWWYVDPNAPDPPTGER